METIEERMSALALKQFGDADLRNRAPGELEWLEKETNDGNSLG